MPFDQQVPIRMYSSVHIRHVGNVILGIYLGHVWDILLTSKGDMLMILKGYAMDMLRRNKGYVQDMLGTCLAQNGPFMVY